MTTEIQREKVYEWLEAVKDPEIPVLSLVDLGVITDLQIQNNDITVTLTPTFVGCPALDMMKSEIEKVLHEHGVEKVIVDVSFSKPWSSDMISAKGKLALTQYAPDAMETIRNFAMLSGQLYAGLFIIALHAGRHLSNLNHFNRP